MGNIKISDLPLLTKKDYQDFVPIVDVSAGETKKITFKDLTASNVELLAVSEEAPLECNEGDKYYNTEDKLIYTATDTDTWGEIGEEPIEDILYVVFSEKNTYAWNGEDMLSVGGGSGSEIVIEPDEPTEDTKLIIEDEDLDFQGLELSNEYIDTDNMAYSCSYINGTILFESETTGGESGDITFNDSSTNYRKIEIEYTDWDQNIYEGIKTIYEPNGKSINLEVTRYNSQNSQAYLASTRYSISGTSMTVDSVYTGLYRLGGNPSSGNYIRIRRIIGYK